MIARNWLARTVYYNSDFENFAKDGTARNVYYSDDFEAHKNLSHKQFSVYYFMEGAVFKGGTHWSSPLKNFDLSC